MWLVPTQRWGVDEQGRRCGLYLVLLGGVAVAALLGVCYSVFGCPPRGHDLWHFSTRLEAVQTVFEGLAIAAGGVVLGGIALVSSYYEERYWDKRSVEFPHSANIVSYPWLGFGALCLVAIGLVVAGHSVWWLAAGAAPTPREPQPPKVAPPAPSPEPRQTGTHRQGRTPSCRPPGAHTGPLSPRIPHPATRGNSPSAAIGSAPSEAAARQVVAGAVGVAGPGSPAARDFCGRAVPGGRRLPWWSVVRSSVALAGLREGDVSG